MTPYKGDGDGGIIARMLQDGGEGQGEAHMLKAGELEARAASEAQHAEEEGEGEEGAEGAEGKPEFAALTAAEMAGGKVLFRRVPVPSHRFTPLKENWMELYQPVVKHMKLQIRMNLKTRSVELRTSEHTEEVCTHVLESAYLHGCIYIYTWCVCVCVCVCVCIYIPV